jgi:hypothetical protein
VFAPMPHREFLSCETSNYTYCTQLMPSLLFRRLNICLTSDPLTDFKYNRKPPLSRLKETSKLQVLILKTTRPMAATYGGARVAVKTQIGGEEKCK